MELLNAGGAPHPPLPSSRVTILRAAAFSDGVPKQGKSCFNATFRDHEGGGQAKRVEGGAEGHEERHEAKAWRGDIDSGMFARETDTHYSR